MGGFDDGYRILQKQVEKEKKRAHIEEDPEE